MTRLSLNPPFQSSFTIETNSTYLVNLLFRKYGKYIARSDVTKGLFISALEKNSSFTISTEQETCQTASPLLKIDEIIFFNTHYDERVFALHGAAVEHGGKAYLFLASTTSGKTTLASYLVHCGHGFITDDCILVDRTSFSVYPHTMPIHLRDGGLEVLERYHAKPEKLEPLDDTNYHRYLYTPANCIATELPLAKIFFITRTEDQNCLVNMDTTARTTALMKAPITQYTMSSEYIKFLFRLSKTPCSELRYCDMQFVEEVIQDDQ